MLSGKESKTNITSKKNGKGAGKNSKMSKLGSQPRRKNKSMKANDDLKNYPENSAKCRRGSEVKQEACPTKNSSLSQKLKKKGKDETIESYGSDAVVGDRDRAVTRKPRRKPAPKSFRKKA